MNEPDPNEAYFRLEASPALIGYRKVTIQLGDSLGHFQATLYDDTLPSLDRLNRLPAGPYRGGTALITILAYRGDRLAYRETRLYDGESQEVLSVAVFKDDAAVVPVPRDTQPLPGKPAGHAPTLASLRGDTLVTIGDSVPLPAEAADADGDLAGYAWDCNGDGRPEDSAALYGPSARIRFGRSFPDPGDHACVLRVWDAEGRSVQGRVGIRVILDPPVADAGKDTTVAVETPILLHAMGVDGYGPVVTREWKIGSAEFKHVTRQETSISAPATAGNLVCILRITDSDGQTGLDTLIVKVVYHSDNTLAELRTNVGSLEPPFRKDVRNYTLSLGAADSLLLILPKASEPHAVATVAGKGLAPSPFGTFPLAEGENAFTIQVTAQDGSTLQYFVTARREGTR